MGSWIGDYTVPRNRKIFEATDIQVIKMVEYGSCPACGDKLRNQTCQDRSGQCGREWGVLYRGAKKREAVKS